MCMKPVPVILTFFDKTDAGHYTIKKWSLKMSGMFYKLGKLAGPSVRKAKWMWDTATNTEEEAIKTEYQVGRDMAENIRSKFGLRRDEKTEKFINRVGRVLAGKVQNKLRHFQFESVSSKQPEAFCLPGGFIFVSRSMAEFCKWDQQEIAFVLAHEMAHILEGHAMERMVSNSAAATVSRLAAARHPVAGLARKAGIKFLERAYSQQQELKADERGLRLMSAAGYQPEGGLEFLRKIEKCDSKSELGKYFSTHPSSKIRIEHLRKLLSRG